MDAPFNLPLAEPLEIESLSPEENHEVTLRRREALAETGRLELDDSAMRLLAQAFISELGEFFPDAVDAFYALRDELTTNIPDEEIANELATATKRMGGSVGDVDIPELARELRNKDDNMLQYSITDDSDHTYFWNPDHWSYDELSPGWDGEYWEADYDE